MLLRDRTGQGFLLLAAYFCWSAGAGAQQPEPNLNREDSAALVLRSVQLAATPAERLTHLEWFVADFTQDADAGWAWEQIQQLHIGAGRHREAVEAGEKLVAADPDDMLAMHRTLEAARSSGDAGLAEAWEARTAALANRIVSVEPKEDSRWQGRVELARQILAHLEYADYGALLEVKDLKQRLKRIDEFAAKYPNSQYAVNLRGQRQALVAQSGEPAQRLAAAERMLMQDRHHDDSLIVVAEALFAHDRDLPRVMALSQSLIQVMATRPKPEGMTEVAWAQKKANYTGRAHWMIGRMQVDQGEYGKAIRSLSLAMPALREMGGPVASALFYIGWAHYRNGDYDAAIRYYQQCAKMRSPLQAQAVRNLSVIESERGAR
ncbi:MAG: tetratricopeptide repeat protein [Bryobacterales bacterium]|nr:tetratricopeptide repeat protein [Bryobacterales bacterium]